MLQHLNGYFFTGLIVKPASGKTSLCISFLTGKGKNKVWRKCFNHVIVVMPSTSRGSMKKNPFKNHHEDQMYEELNYNTIKAIHNKLTSYSDENENTLLILDDVGASLKNNDIQQIFRKIIYNRRHLKCHIVVLLQSFMSIPKEIRKMFNNIFMFKPSKVEFENLFDELFETNKDLAIDIMNFAYDKPHQYLMLNVDTQRMYKGFDEIIIKKDEN
jgi:KaiC/GvpD/RAD55 family RecA-like ATPase